MRSAEIKALLHDARDISSELKHATSTEELADLLERADQLDERARGHKSAQDRAGMLDALDMLPKPSHVAGQPRAATVFDSVKAAGWEFGRKASIPTEVAIGTKAIIDDPDNAQILRVPGILAETADTRFVYPRLPLSDPGDATSVTALVSQGRSLDADVADLTSTAEKAVTDSAAVLVDFRMQRAATVSNFYSNGIVQLSAFRTLINDDLTTAYRQALDAYVVGELVSGAETTDDDDGSDGSLIGQIRVGQKVVQDAGMTPNLVIPSSADAMALDLLRAVPTGAYLLDPSPRANGATPLFGMDVVVGVGVTDPIVMDTSAAQVYVGRAEFSADATTEFSTNQSRFRLESPCLCVVRAPQGIYVVAATS